MTELLGGSIGSTEGLTGSIAYQKQRDGLPRAVGALVRS